MRLFIAIELADEIKASLAHIQEVLKRSPSQVKWVNPGQIHLTLRFLGETAEEKLEALKGAIREVAEGLSPFEFTLGPLGAFPKLENPRVLWVGIEKGQDSAKDIAQKLEEALALLGFQKEERAFTPHVTLGRVRFIKDRTRLVRTLKSPSLTAEGSMTVTALSLIESTLTPQGPVYRTLDQFPLLAR
ncbi:MAG: RNA 2',3'-cyclic phosphodiesterase [Candidatus Omnitrophica bacterium]|nr:RNA 2',3'-cyclic phosphodiesterase [Candidatus Omnitrophota bacterium]